MRRKVCLATVVLLIFFCLCLTAAGQLETRASFPVNDYPKLIAAGDFNKDGNQDVAVECPESLCGGAVQVLLGRGDGTFSSATSYSIPNCPDNGLAVADLNGDGNLDIVTSEEVGYAVAVLLGNGDGTFQPVLSSPAAFGGDTLRVGDFNNDGIPDVALAIPGFPNSYISVLFGNGDGTFQSPLSTTLSEQIEDLVVGDLNGDGNLDILWESTISTDLHVLLGNGDGTFQAGPVYLIAGPSPNGVATGDLNGDGILDIVSVGDLFVDVLLGTGDGTFGQHTTYPIASGGGAVLIVDMNGDGIPDLVFPSSKSDTISTIAIMLGVGDGTFGPERFFGGGKSASGLAGADFNGDRQPDVVVTDFFGSAVTTLLNTGVVAFSPTTTLRFLQQLVGTTSAPQTVKLTNTGSAALGISSITVSGRGLGMQTSCGQTVAPGGSCRIRLNFAPTVSGSVRGAVTLVDTASSKPQVIPVAAAGTVIYLSPTSLHFPPQKVGTKSAPKDVTVTNTGTKTVTFTSINVTTTNYSETNTCGTQLAAGASCTVSVTFNPTVGGPAIATLNISDNGGSSPQGVAVEGKATK